MQTNIVLQHNVLNFSEQLPPSHCMLPSLPDSVYLFNVWC